jgi:tetratricopeptide (TPR) repeat protein
MNKAKFVLGAMLAVAGPVAVLSAALVPSVAVAQQKVSVNVGKPLKTAQDAIAKRRWDAALAAIKQAQAVQPQTAFDTYKINELLWYVYLQQGRNADAARVLEQQIASGQMPANEKTQRTKTLTQLYARAGSYGKVIQTGTQYLKAVPGDRDIQVQVAQAYYQQKDYKNAIAFAQRAAGSGQPPEELLQLILRSQYEMGDKAGTSKTLEQLLKYYPSPETWRSLLNTYFAQTKHDHELLALYRLSQDVGALTKGRDYNDMAQALVVGGYAMEGQRVMEQGIAANLFTGEDLSRAQRTLDAAKRKADAERQVLPSAEKNVALAKSGEDLYKAGKLLFSAGQYDKAADAFSKAVAKGGVSDADDATMMLGISLARTGKKAEASKAFDAIKDPKYAEVGKLWKLRR